MGKNSSVPQCAQTLFTDRVKKERYRDEEKDEKDVNRQTVKARSGEVEKK